MKKVLITFIIFAVIIAAGYWIINILRKQQFIESVSTTKATGTESGKSLSLEQQRELIWKDHNEEGNEETVIKYAKKYLEKASKDEDIWICLAENYIWTNKLDEAEKAVKEVLSLNSESIWGLRVLAEIYRLKAEKLPDSKQQYLSKAQSKIDKALSIDPEDPWVNIEAALVYLAQGRKQESLDKINEALKLEPNNEYFLSIKEEILSKESKESVE